MIRGMSLRHGLIVVGCIVAVGCAQRPNEPVEDPIAAAPAHEAAIEPLAENDAPPPELFPAAPVADGADRTEKSIDELPVATELELPLPTLSLEEITLELPEPTVVAGEPAAVQEFEHAPALISSPAASPMPAEPLDFASLVTRLRKTKAINLRTKVAVKNESDDLLEQFRAYHTQDGLVTLADLRRSYESLFRKLHGLLEETDPPLARDIDLSQAAIWELLADPSRFTASVMAGA
jgi:hypothetical protein